MPLIQIDSAGAISTKLLVISTLPCPMKIGCRERSTELLPGYSYGSSVLSRETGRTSLSYLCRPRMPTSRVSSPLR
jgi:hypothetical protein